MDWGPTDPRLRRSVLEAIESILEPGELQELTVDVRDPGLPAWNEAGDASSGTWLHVVAADEVFDFWLDTPPGTPSLETVDEMKDRLVLQIQDWVAESRFGWGQLRNPRTTD